MVAATKVAAASKRPLAALAVAVVGDAVQLVLAPLFGEGFASPLNDALDVAIAGALVWLLGFHWALLPAAATELVPGVDLAPTWTASVLFIIAPARARRWILAGAIALAALAAFLVYRTAR
jgi:hypothetical protein